METLLQKPASVSDSGAATNGHHRNPKRPDVIEQRKKRNGSHTLIRILQGVLDVITVYGSFLLAHAISSRVELFPLAALPPLPLHQVLLYSGVSSVLAVAFMVWQGAYTPSINHMKLDGDRRFIRALIMTTFVVFIPFFYAQTRADTRELMTITVVVLPTLMILQKTLAVAVLSKQYDTPVRTRKLLIVGSDHDAPYVLRQALSCWDPGYLPVGFLARDAANIGNSVETESRGLVGSSPVIGSYDQLEKVLKRHAIEEIWINDPDMPREDLIAMLALCDERGVEASMLPRIGRIPAMAVSATYAGGQVLLRERRAPERLYYDRMKRAVDLSAAILGLLMLSPVFILVSLWVRLDSKGPALFKQERVGKDGRVFPMYKFRSMYTNAPKYSVSPTSRFDPRITKAGRVLRKTSLDELPQLINVLRGEMSLVGPRPEQPFLTENYDRFQRARLQVKPGITGLWQISADRSIPIHDNLDYDLYYIQNRSLTTDMVILWRTLYFAIRGI